MCIRDRWMKFLTFVVILALAYHAWVGMRNIWMDYIKPVGLRLVLEVFTIVWLLGLSLIHISEPTRPY